MINDNNPLLTYTELPPFHKIQPHHVEPAITFVLRQHQKCLKKLLTQPQPFTWENLLAPLEEADDILHKIWGVIAHLNAVTNSPKWREAHDAVLPKISSYATKVAHNHKLYAAVQSIRKSKQFQKLNDTQRKIITEMLRDFRLTGATLLPKQKIQFAKLKLELDKLHNQFANNVLDATHNWHYLANTSEVGGIPPHILAIAKKAARQQKQPGYLFSLDVPTYQAIITFADNRELRQKFYTAFNTRSSDQGPHAKKYDNSKIIEKILQHRSKIAKLLNYKNYAQFSLATKTARNPQQVINFLNKLTKCVKKSAQQEFTELTEFAAKHYAVNKLEPWDITYYGEKLRQRKYKISEEEIRQYFPLQHVLQNLFTITEKLFDLKIKEISKVSKWHKDVRLFAIYNKKNELRGYFYIDIFARVHKRGGAWMEECSVHRRLTDGSIQKPIAYLNCNFTPPATNKPSLLTHNELVTLFHEFGHCLQHLLSKVDYAYAASINSIPLDAVEFASQFMENWCWQETSLRLLSCHYQSNEPLPTSLIKKLQKSKKMQFGLQTLRQTEFALFDLQLHTMANIKKYTTVQKIIKKVRQQVRVIPTAKFDRLANSFEHIFGGGYAAGYYSYKWSEMMAQDAFALFKKNGILDRKTGKSYLHNILEVGSSIDPIQAFKNFRGREPDFKALLKL